MVRVTAFILAWLIAAPAWAFLPGQPIGMLNPQVQPANASAGLPAVDDNLGAAGYPVAGGICAEWGHQVPCNLHYSTTRASTKYVSASDGLYTSVPVNVLALGSNNGGLIEEARTNDALWSRDMTNAAWVTTTMTTALNAVGIDGTANSATTLTASGALAMAVQTITLSSQADNYSVFLKRVTGSGTVSLCLAATACGTATACTVTSTTTFTRCTVTATVLNPIVGIQISTNGDAVIADFNQMEPGSFPLSPILTSTATATRAADNVTITGAMDSILRGGTGTVLVYSNIGNNNSGAGNSRLIGDNLTHGLILRVGSGQPAAAATFNGSVQINTANTTNWANPNKSGVRWTTAPSRSIILNGGTIASDANSVQVSTTYFLGSSASVAYIDGPLTRIVGYNSALPDTSFQAGTQ